MGAMLGTAYGQLVHWGFPEYVGPAGAYGLVGMGAVFAAAARAPITAVIIIFELTGDYQIILPLMFAVALATSIANLLSRDTIYTLKLWRRGIDVTRGRGPNLMQILTVGQAMQPVPKALPQERPLAEVVARFAHENIDALPVADAEGRYLGTVLAREVEQSLRDNATDITAGQAAQETPVLTASQTLEQALVELVRSNTPGLPVVDGAHRALVGWLSHRDVLRLYSERAERRSNGP
jgi:CIC family chloride channel protein